MPYWPYLLILALKIKLHCKMECGLWNFIIGYLSPKLINRSMNIEIDFRLNLRMIKKKKKLKIFEYMTIGNSDIFLEIFQMGESSFWKHKIIGRGVWLDHKPFQRLFNL